MPLPLPGNRSPTRLFTSGNIAETTLTANPKNYADSK
jgi:hypothetical protein